ncbi:MAG: hypothetical protein V7K55_02410 [Nostoc sp.]|uniref:hypothetical protein n=1 Tax=Nostoc sp. TaxID=1180 RepID=UPI002FFBDECF
MTSCNSYHFLDVMLGLGVAMSTTGYDARCAASSPLLANAKGEDSLPQLLETHSRSLFGVANPPH